MHERWTVACIFYYTVKLLDRSSINSQVALGGVFDPPVIQALVLITYANKVEE